ncbi:hypothetical protein [Polaromonas naphthalenivorans]|uniref:hypothetical protein n=1 Tax=Polaromonas naphthalenivorans TaxID=216465 RepID=UPI0002E96115|nr:hypothetical protein [Polaromonas naphthalenivorans]
MADPTTAKALRDHLEAKGPTHDPLISKVLNTLQPMVAHTEARRVLDEIENKPQST